MSWAILCVGVEWEFGIGFPDVGQIALDHGCTSVSASLHSIYVGMPAVLQRELVDARGVGVIR